MKIARAVIENFRHIKRLELDFTDSLGRVRDTTLLIGPNASGKTTVLDALAVSIGIGTELTYGRPDFILSPRTIVRRGSLHTKVTCRVRFSPEEIATTKELSRIRAEKGNDSQPQKTRIYDLAKELKLDNKRVIEEARREGIEVSVPSNFVPAEVAERIRLKYVTKNPPQAGLPSLPWPPVPDDEEVELTWTYPDPNNRSTLGFTQCAPNWGWTLFKGRVTVARLLSTGRIGWEWFQRVGAVFTFDQQRAGMEKTIPREIWEIIQGQSVGSDTNDRERRTSDPKTILLNLAVQSLLPPGSGSQQPDQFKLIQERYAQVCWPHSLVGAVRDDSGTPDLVFNDGTYDYRYDGLSSGEQMLLLFLIRMASEHIHQSVVLVDEIELHQHPVWQRKLLHLLPKMGDGNQVIATTHSPYLRDVTPPEAVIELGEVLEPAFAPAD
jgi:predicted ATPase